jgi:hypothetical protein
MSSKKKYEVTQRWKDRHSDGVLYRVAVDGVELASTIRIQPTQIASKGEAALLAWCSHHTDKLTEHRIVDVDLNEKVIMIR